MPAGNMSRPRELPPLEGLIFESVAPLIAIVSIVRIQAYL